MTEPARVPRVAWAIAGVFVIAELALSGRYGYEQDEMYFLVAGHHLAFGYVDQPPLTPLLDRVMSGAFGINPTAVRVIPALAGGAVIVSAAKFAGLFGAGRLGRVLAALACACAPVVIGASHESTTTPIDLLAWTLVLLCVTLALLREEPRWWLAAGAAAGIGLENKNLLVFLLLGLGVGLLFSPYRAGILRSWWPWAGLLLAVAIWVPNLAWQATHHWTQLTMASALHSQHSAVSDYALALPAQIVYPGLVAVPLTVAGFVVLWRTPELRFIAWAATLIVVYVVLWVPGKPYYTDGMVPAVLAAGAAAAERWAKRAPRPWEPAVRRRLLVAAPLVGLVTSLPVVLPLVPIGNLHDIPGVHKLNGDIVDEVGWPALDQQVRAAAAALARSGEPVTSIFTTGYPEAAALGVYGSPGGLPVLSGQNSYWMWGPGTASDAVVLAVGSVGQLQQFFVSCRVLSVYEPPYHVDNDFGGMQIGVCTRPSASWTTLWPLLQHYD